MNNLDKVISFQPQLQNYELFYVFQTSSALQSYHAGLSELCHLLHFFLVLWLHFYLVTQTLRR